MLWIEALPLKYMWQVLHNSSTLQVYQGQLTEEMLKKYTSCGKYSANDSPLPSHCIHIGIRILKILMVIMLCHVPMVNLCKSLYNHAEDKAYKCEEGGKTSLQFFNLNSHYRNHTRKKHSQS